MRRRQSARGNRTIRTTPAEETTCTNMKIAALIVLACIAWQAECRAQEGSRGLLKRGLLSKGKPTTTTTTTAAPQDEEEYVDESEYPAEEAAEPSSEAPPSSTEGKKLVGSGVRPFRSNTDLLETLKRRRAQAAEAKLHSHSASSTAAPDTPNEAPVKASYNKKRYNSPNRDTNVEESPAQSKPSRNRFGKPSSKALVEEVEEPIEATPPPRTGRAFLRRGSN